MSSQNIYYSPYNHYDNSDCDLELEFHNYIAHYNSDELEEAYATREQINPIAMSYAPNKGTLVKYTENGKDELSDLTTSEKEIDFLSEYTYSSDDDFDYEPSKALKYKFPFSSVGVNVGVKFNF